MEIVSEPTVNIEIGGVRSSYWSDLWRNRELLYTLTWRDLIARYKQTALGSLWNIIRPLITMLIFTFVMRAARFPTHGAPAAIFVWAGLLPWQFFASGMGEAANSIVLNGTIVAKIYFPRILVPLGSVIVCLFDFFVSFLLLMGLALIIHFRPGGHFFILPLVIVQLFALVFGSGLFFAAVTVKLRDMRQILPMVIQLGIYATPVFYPVEIVGRVLSHKLIWIYSLNPMVGIIEGFRWTIIGRSITLDPFTIEVSVVETILILALGMRHFLKSEMTFADNL